MNPPVLDFSNLSRTLFYNEGHTVALLVKNKPHGHTVKPMRFVRAEDALVWCRGHGAMLVCGPAWWEQNWFCGDKFFLVGRSLKQTQINTDAIRKAHAVHGSG